MAFDSARSLRVFRLTGPLYVYAAAEDFVLLYPVYVLLFAEHGMSVAQIGSLFMFWSGAGLVAAVPAGALADVVPRRYLLAAAPVSAAAGFVLWSVAPGYAGFAAGFVLWGFGGSLSSGALEALVHDELVRRGAGGRYARVMGVARALSVVAVGAATLAAVPVMAWGGYAAVCAASVVACGVCAAAAAVLPERRSGRYGLGGGEGAPGVLRGYVAVLREGLVEARGDRRVRGAIVVLVVVTSFWGVLDEYVPLLVSGHGVVASAVPVVVAVVWAGVTVGGLSAGAVARLPVRGFAVLVGAAAVVVAVGAVVGGVAGWVSLGAGFGVFQAACVVVDARLQDRIRGSGRATVTSVAGLGSDVVTMAAYPLYAVVFASVGHGWAFAVFVVPYLVVACVLGVGAGRGG